MSTANPVELNASAVIERIEAGEYPREVVLTIARGFLPLSQDDLIIVLSFLISKRDEEIAQLARAALSDLPTRSVMDFASNESIPEANLALLMRATEDATIIERLVRNRALPDSAVLELTQSPDAAIQEVIVINQARILRTPDILDALLANPQLSADARRRALETREEFFDKKAKAALELPPDAIAEDLPTFKIADLLEKAAEEDQSGEVQDTLMPSALDDADPQRVSVFAKIVTMSVSEKVQLAFKGGKSERSILIRDRNKLVCSAVMRNPRLSESEVESIAGMRNVDDEVLRLVTAKREWMSKYNITLTLARNPKAPIGVVLPLINRLTLRDLKSLKDDKGVSEAARAHARKLFQQRSQKS